MYADLGRPGRARARRFGVVGRLIRQGDALERPDAVSTRSGSAARVKVQSCPSR